MNLAKSDFGANALSAAAAGDIDFSKAVRLERSGSTCDAFMATHGGRRVFVKKLKEEHRLSDLHRKAFAKEFEVGSRLSHPALPYYVELGPDYIVMDYVDGSTVADLIAACDPLLGSDATLRRMLGELLDAVDYLHRHDVVHCDIKSDNVMITHELRNVKLIDLDKAYTDWSIDTNGDPDRYGLETASSPDMDFRGIGKLLDSIEGGGYSIAKFRRFREACDRRGITSAELRRLLEKGRQKRRLLPAAAVLIVLGMATAALLALRTRETPEATAGPATDTVQTAVAPPIATQPTAPTPAAATPDYKAVIDRELPAMATAFEQELDRAEALLADPAADADTLRGMVDVLVEANHDFTIGAYARFERRFPDADAAAIQLAVVSAPAYRALLDRHARLVSDLAARLP